MGEKNSRIYQSVYKDWASYVAENDDLRVEMVPELGGKLVSLLRKGTGKEWLLDSGSRPLRMPEYGSGFSDWDMSGWDECFPTIDICLTGEGGTIRLPDHGEIWSLPWRAEVAAGSITAWTEGRQLPYRFSRTLEITGERTVSLRYEARNLGEVPWRFLWAAHPQFNVDEPTRILVPEEMDTLLCVFGGLSHAEGSSYDVPSPWVVDGSRDGNGLKFYCPNPVREAWSGLYGLNSGNYLILKTDREKAPYWGVWIDTGMFNDRAAIALEPGIGYYDSLSRAESNGTAALVKPGGSYGWTLDIEIGYVERGQESRRLRG